MVVCVATDTSKRAPCSVLVARPAVYDSCECCWQKKGDKKKKKKKKAGKYKKKYPRSNAIVDGA